MKRKFSRQSINCLEIESERNVDLFDVPKIAVVDSFLEVFVGWEIARPQPLEANQLGRLRLI